MEINLKKHSSQKWHYILIRGCLLSGFTTAFVYSLLSELSYTSLADPALFLQKMTLRLAVSVFLFMAAGLGVGHWMWTYRNFQNAGTGSSSCFHTHNC